TRTPTKLPRKSQRTLASLPIGVLEPPPEGADQGGQDQGEDRVCQREERQQLDGAEGAGVDEADLLGKLRGANDRADRAGQDRLDELVAKGRIDRPQGLREHNLVEGHRRREAERRGGLELAPGNGLEAAADDL